MHLGTQAVRKCTRLGAQELTGYDLSPELEDLAIIAKLPRLSSYRQMQALGHQILFSTGLALQQWAILEGMTVRPGRSHEQRLRNKYGHDVFYNRTNRESVLEFPADLSTLRCPLLTLSNDS